MFCCFQSVVVGKSGDSVLDTELEEMHIRRCLLHYFRAGKVLPRHKELFAQSKAIVQ